MSDLHRLLEQMSIEQVQQERRAASERAEKSEQESNEARARVAVLDMELTESANILAARDGEPVHVAAQRVVQERDAARTLNAQLAERASEAEEARDRANDYLAEARAEVERLSQERDDVMGVTDAYMHERDAARAEVAALKAQLASVAERQREACAQQMLFSVPADHCRATPLVTDKEQP